MNAWKDLVMLAVSLLVVVIGFALNARFISVSFVAIN
jgi:hypothetical protein